jgi:L-seryl-tRNA(Ser) seleniumtransferase
MTDPRRAIPSVAALLALDAVRAASEGAPHARVVAAARSAVAEVREGRDTLPSSLDAWGERIVRALTHPDPHALRRVVNATGVVLHTNLGRAPLAPEAVAAIARRAAEYCTLEYDLESGARGGRQEECVDALRALTGADDALVVNNGAAAVTLAVHALAGGGAVAISRGELVEIGGSFRVPEVMRVAGVTLHEVGTTNRTHLADYVAALDAGARAVVKVHRSNFRVVGFTAEADERELARLCRERGVPLIHDFGSGLLVSLERFALTGEPTAAEVVRAGASVVAMSGDKLLGGPQAGILLGARAVIETLRRNPFARAVRVDKLTLAALGATLALYADAESATRRVPTLRLITTPVAELEERATALADRVRHAGIGAAVVTTEGAVGAGAFPAVPLPSAAVALPGEPARVMAALRAQAMPVIGRVRDGKALVDLRSVLERDDDLLGDMIVAALA